MALLELATQYQSGEPLQIRQIAAQQNIPDRYLEQFASNLKAWGQKPTRGKSGYILAREPWKITIRCLDTSLKGLKLARLSDEASPKTVEIVPWFKKSGRKHVRHNFSLAKVYAPGSCEQRSADDKSIVLYLSF